MPQTNILIVEDDLTTQEMARMVLENAGYGISVARSAEDADRVIRTLWPDIVLMDRELPGMDGLELTRRLKVAEETSGITIIAFSSRNTTEDNELAISAGSDGFVHKPFTVRGLLQTVAWHVSAREKRPVPPSSNGSSSMGGGSTDGNAAWEATAAHSRRAQGFSNLFGGFMTISRTVIVSGILVFAAARPASAQTTAQHTITFQVDAINQVSATGAPSLVINAAVAGSAPTSVTSASSSWAVTTNQSTAKITASINTVMPAGVTLSANLQAPLGGAASTGLQALGTAAVDMVTGITKVAQGGMTITYQLDATSAAGVITNTSRVVTYTITGGV